MNCSKLAGLLEQERMPDAPPAEVARASLMLFNAAHDPGMLDDSEYLERSWSELSGQLRAVTDQHEAMTAELENIACGNAVRFSPDQVWALLRAIRVQSRVLAFYHAEPSVV